MIWGFPDTGIVEQNSRYIVQQYVRECLKVWLHVSEKHGICMCVCLRVWVSVCGRVCIHECKCLSVPEQAGAARSCLIDILSSLFIFDAFLHPNLWSYFLLPAESAFYLSQCRHKHPKSIGDIRVERAPGRDGPPSAFTVPQLVCAVDGQALQVVPSTAPTSSSSSWGPSSSLDLGQLWFFFTVVLAFIFFPWSHGLVILWPLHHGLVTGHVPGGVLLCHEGVKVNSAHWALPSIRAAACQLIVSVLWGTVTILFAILYGQWLVLRDTELLPL